MATVLDKHFHCPDCHPTLVRGSTPAICGVVIAPPIVGSGPTRKCPACRSALRQHKAAHRGRR